MGLLSGTLEFKYVDVRLHDHEASVLAKGASLCLQSSMSLYAEAFEEFGRAWEDE